MKQDRILYLLRGLPGAGKSTLADLLVGSNEYNCHEYRVFEADQYHIDPITGDYNWKPENLPNAHADCFARVELAMQWNIESSKYYNRIAVANTFTTEKELQPYLDLATKYDYTIVSIVVENRHGNKSIHGVPDAALDAMSNRFTYKLK